MSELEIRLRMAEEHAKAGRRIVARQEALMAERQAHGYDLAGMQELLGLFKSTQRIFEDDLRRLRAEAYHTGCFLREGAEVAPPLKQLDAGKS